MAVPTGAVWAAAGIVVTPTVVLPLAFARKPIPELFEIESVPNVRVFVVLPVKATPLVPPETDVFPKLIATLELLTRMPSEVEPEIVVLPKTTVPETVCRLIPCVPLEVDATLENPEVAVNVPLVRFNAMPEPFKVISGVVLSPAVKLTNPVPKIFAPVVLPIVKPRTVFP